MHCWWDYDEKQLTQNEKILLAKSEVLDKQKKIVTNCEIQNENT